MLSFFKRYPFSLLVFCVATYLSFFRPPSIELPDMVFGFDKVAHLCMYAGMSGVFWLEFFRSRRVTRSPWWYGLVGASLFPTLYGGVVELVQEYATTWRGGDWGDMAANALGVVLGTLAAHLIRKRVERTA